MSEPSAPLPSIAELRRETLRVFRKRLCLFQAQGALHVLRRTKSGVLISGTGSGKTLVFWVPLLFRSKGIQIIVTPLNVLGQQNVEDLERVGIKAISLTAKTASAEAFEAISLGKYRAVIVNPEILMKDRGRFEKLWAVSSFTENVLSIVFDEAHCAGIWGDFRPEYREIYRLRYLIPESIPFFLASATLPTPLLKQVIQSLHIHPNEYEIIRRSVDRHNISIKVRKIERAATSFEDVFFLLPEECDSSGCHSHETKVEPALIFVDNITEGVNMGDAMRAKLPPEYRDRIRWFNADMSQTYRDDALRDFREGRVWILICTDSFGMGLDVPNIKIVVQWKVTCTMAMLWQRFGRAVRDLSLLGRALLLAEPKHFDDEKLKAANRKVEREAQAKRREAKKRKASGPHSTRAAKKTRTVSSTHPILVHNQNEDPDAREDGSGSEDEDVEEDVNDEANKDDDMEITAPNQDLSVMQAGEEALRAAAQAGLLEARELYHSHPGAKGIERTKKAAKAAVKELEPVLDDLINAKENGKFDCRRKPISIYFGNDQISADHEACDRDNREGCGRCRIPRSSSCCDLCDPSLSSFGTLSMRPAATKAKVPKITKKYEATDQDRALKQALDAFREKVVVEEFGEEVAEQLGSCIILCDDTLQRIVDCAHAGRLRSPQILFDLTKWNRSTDLGPRIIAIVNNTHPSPVICMPAPPTRASSSSTTNVPTPLSPSKRINGSASTSNAASSRIRRPGKCGKCGNEGHNASNRSCPNYSASELRAPRTCRSCGAIGHIASSFRCPRHPRHAPPSDSILLLQRLVPSTSRAALASVSQPSVPSTPPRNVHSSNNPPVP